MPVQSEDFSAFDEVIEKAKKAPQVKAMPEEDFSAFDEVIKKKGTSEGLSQPTDGLQGGVSVSEYGTFPIMGGRVPKDQEPIPGPIVEEPTNAADLLGLQNAQTKKDLYSKGYDVNKLTSDLQNVDTDLIEDVSGAFTKDKLLQEYKENPQKYEDDIAYLNFVSTHRKAVAALPKEERANFSEIYLTKDKEEGKKLADKINQYGGDYKRELLNNLSKMTGDEYKFLDEELDKESSEKGSRLGYIYNSFLNGIGSVSSGASDVMMQILTTVLPEKMIGGTKEEALAQWRNEVEPVTRTAMSQLIGADVGENKQKKYEKEFWTSAIGGLAGSVPMMVSPYGTGLFLGSYDAGLQSINNTEEGKKLPESTKSIFAVGVGLAGAALEKVGLDKIFGKQSKRAAIGIASKTISDLLEKSTAPITKEVFEAALNANAKTIKQKIIDAGGKIGRGASIEALTGASQEAANVVAEKLLNASQKKEVFQPQSMGEIAGRVIYAGAQEGVGGGLLGGLSAFTNKTRNYISEKVAEAKTPEDIQKIKNEVIVQSQKNKIGQNESEQLIKLVDDYANINSKVPENVENRKEVINTISERDEIKAQIDAKQQELNKADDAFKPELQKELDALQGRYDELNEEAVAISKGEKPVEVAAEVKAEPQEGDQVYRVDYRDEQGNPATKYFRNEEESRIFYESTPGEKKGYYDKFPRGGKIEEVTPTGAEAVPAVTGEAKGQKVEGAVPTGGERLGEGAAEAAPAVLEPTEEQKAVSGKSLEKVTIEPIDFENESENIDIYEASKAAEKIAKDNGVNILRGKDLRSVALDKNGNVIGGIWTEIDGNEFSFDIAIDKIAQGKGVGERLVNEAISEFKAQNYENQLKYKIDVTNPIMEKLLSKYGFKVTERVDGHAIMEHPTNNPKLSKKPTEVAPTPTTEAKPETVVGQDVVIQQMKPFTDEMVKIEREFENNNYEIRTDYDNEIIVTDKDGEIVDAEDLPPNLLKLAQDYEKAVGKLGEFDASAMEKALAESRKVEEGQAEVVETEQAKLPPAAKPKVAPPAKAAEKLKKAKERRVVPVTPAVPTEGINVSNKSDLVDLLDRVQEESKKRILQAAQKGINTLKSIFPDMDIYVHETADSYNAAMIPNKGVRNSRGNFSFYEQDGKTKGRIDINLSNASETTVAHEITHAILLKQFGEDLATFKQFRDRISKVIAEDLDKELVAFEAKYKGLDVAPEEYLTQLAAILATRAETVTYKPSTLKKIAAIINELVTRITNGKFSPFKSEADFKNFVDFLNQISGAIREGAEINLQEKEQGDAVVSGVVPLDKIKNKSDLGFKQYDVKWEIPKEAGIQLIVPEKKETLYNIVEKSGGAVVVINSDATGIGITKDKDLLQGGIGYTFIDANVKENVGFAASSDSKIPSFYEAILDAANKRDAEYPEMKGKPVAVFVMVQTPAAMFGNAYSADYFGRVLSKITKSELFSTKEAKKELIEFIEDYKANNKTGQKYSNSLDKLIDLIKATDFSKKQSIDKLVDLLITNRTSKEDKSARFGFDIRRSFFEKFFVGVGTVKEGAPARNLRLKLKEKGYNHEGFFKEFGDKNVMSLLEGDTPGRKLSDGNFTLTGFFVDPNTSKDEYIQNSKKGTYQHKQFNSKFYGTNPFVLDGKYYVDEMFPEARFVSKKTGEEVPVQVAAAGSLYPRTQKSAQQIIERAKNIKSRAQLVHDETGFISVPSMIEIVKSNDPDYLGGVMQHIQEMGQKLKSGKVNAKDVAKSYLMAVSSIRSGDIGVEKFESAINRKVDEVFLEPNNKIRTEGAMAFLLTTDEGKRFLKNVESGKIDEKDREFISKSMKPFGMFGVGESKFNNIFGGTEKNQINLTNIAEFNSLLKKGIKNESELFDAIVKLKGISQAKVGFVSNFLGIGTRGVIDAREIQGWLRGAVFQGERTAKEAEIEKELTKSNKSLSPLQREILDRMRAVGNAFNIDPLLAEYIGHHMIWDAVAKEKTTHNGLYLAMSQNDSEFYSNLNKIKSRQDLSSDLKDVESTTKALEEAANKKFVDDEPIREWNGYKIGEVIDGNKLPNNPESIEGKFKLEVIPVNMSDVVLNGIATRENFKKDDYDGYQTEILNAIKDGFDTNSREPIEVIRSKDGIYHSLDGHHRLTIANELGRKSILAFVKEETPQDISYYGTKYDSLLSISEAYHKAKEDGTNPELVKAVEDLLSERPTGIKSRQDIGEDYSEMKDIVQDYLDEGISLDDTIESITSELGDSSQETKDLITRAYNELKGGKPEEKAAKPEEAPKVEDKEAKKEFNELISSEIDNFGTFTNYLSGKTIKKYEGDELRNEQQVLAQQLKPALERGLEIIQKAKEVFGDNYVTGLLNYLETASISLEKKALAYVSLENELAKQKMENPSDAPRIEKLQDLVRAASQAYLRSNSLAINFGRLRKFAEIGYDVSKMTDRFFSSRQLEDKKKIEESIQATPDQINKAAEEKIKEDEEIKKKIEEGVEAEIAKLFEKFSDAKKKVINKSLSAIDKAMSKLSSKSYKSGFKSRSDLDDAMTEGFKKIKRAMKAGISPAEAIEIGIKEIKSIYEKEYGTTWTDEAAFRKDLTEALKAEGAISVNLIKKRIEELESQIKIYQEKIEKGGVPGEKRKGKFSDVEEVQKLIKERDELRKQNQKLIRESREQSGEMSRSEKALQKRIEALETELERVKFRKEKEKPEKNTPAEKKLTEREKELIKAIELENEKWDAEIDAARQMAKDYEKLETERNRQLKKVGELKEKLEILKSGKFPEGKKIEPKADTPEIEALKKEIEDTEKELRKNLAHQKRLDELEKELQRLKDRKEKEKNPEKKKEYSYDETLLRDQIEKERLDWKIEKNIEKLNKELDRVRNRREKITDPKQKRELTDEEKRITDEIKEEQKKWSEERVPIKKLENDILKLNEQIEKGQKDKFEKKATRESEALDRLRKEKAEKQAILEALDPTPRMFIENALIEQGFGREINVRTKDGVEKRMVLDWKKLAGEEGSVDNIKERVEAALRDKGYSEEQILRMKDAFVEEYNNLAASIAEKALNEINAKNKEGVTIEQKSAVRKLVEMYNYGLFDKDPVEYETALAKTLGVTGMGVDAVRKMAELGQTMSNLFNSNFEGQPLNESTLRTAIQVIEEQARVILNMEALKGGNWWFKVTELTRMYMDVAQRMMLNTFKQGLENPISGLLERFYSSVAYAGKIPETLNAQQRKLARDIYKEIVLQKGLGYGNVGNAFITTGNIDAYIHKLPDSALVQGIMSVAMGKTILDAVDSSYKAKITQQKFTYNLIKILTKDRVINGKTVKGMSLDEAKKYVADKISGQSFEKAKQTAKEIIDRVNRDAGRKIFNDSPQFVNRLANDIVNAALINGEAITEEMVTAAYNAAYRAAGRGLGHVSNNILTTSVNYLTGKIETQRKKAIEEKKFTNAAFLNLFSTFFRNVLNPFVGGGTNWIVLKAEKAGLGLVSGFISKVKDTDKIDMTSETGMRELEDAMYNDMKANDKLTRGAIGGMVTALAFLLIKGTAAEDEYEKWIKKNPWAKKYINVFTPEIVLLMIAANATEKDYIKYLENTLNLGNQFDKGKMALKVLHSKDHLTQFGTLLNSSIGSPLPWRLVRDGQQLWAGATGGEPYVVSKEKPKDFFEAYLKGGMIDFFQDMMSKEPKEKKIGEKFPESKGIKWLEDKNTDMPELPDLEKIKVNVDNKHPEGKMTAEEQAKFKEIWEAEAVKVADQIQKNHEKYQYTLDKEKLKQIRQRISEVATKETHEKMMKYYKRDRLSSRDEEMFKIKILGKEIE